METSSGSDSSRSLRIQFVNPPDNSDIMILNRSDMQVMTDIKKEADIKEEEEEPKGEKEKGKKGKRGGHAN